jgi:hypothetical protein
MVNVCIYEYFSKNINSICEKQNYYTKLKKQEFND